MTDMLAAIESPSLETKRGEDVTDCLISLIDPENDSPACWRRRKVGAAVVAKALFEQRAIRLENRALLRDVATAIQNLAKALGAR